MDWGKLFDRAINVISLILVGLGTWYTYQGVHPVEGPKLPDVTVVTPWWAYGLLVVGVLLLVPSWLSLISRRKARGAELKVLIRADKDAQEVSKDNVFRWYIMSRTSEIDGKSVRVVTHIFVVFDRPIDARYRNFACSKPGIVFNAMDYSPRSAIVTSYDDTTDSIVELKFSGKPI